MAGCWHFPSSRFTLAGHQAEPYADIPYNDAAVYQKLKQVEAVAL